MRAGGDRRGAAAGVGVEDGHRVPVGDQIRRDRTADVAEADHSDACHGSILS